MCHALLNAQYVSSHSILQHSYEVGNTVPFYRWGNAGMKSSRSLLRVTEQQGRTPDFRAHTLKSTVTRKGSVQIGEFSFPGLSITT